MSKRMSKKEQVDIIVEGFFEILDYIKFSDEEKDQIHNAFQSLVSSKRVKTDELWFLNLYFQHLPDDVKETLMESDSKSVFFYTFETVILSLVYVKEFKKHYKKHHPECKVFE